MSMSKLPLPVPGINGQNSTQPSPGSGNGQSSLGKFISPVSSSSHLLPNPAYSSTPQSSSHYSAHPAAASTGIASNPSYYSHDTSSVPSQYIGMDHSGYQSYSQPQSATSHTPTSAGALSYGTSHIPQPYDTQHTGQNAYSQFQYPTATVSSSALPSSVSAQSQPFRNVMSSGAGPLVSSRPAESNMLETYNKAIYPSTPDTTGQICPPGAKPRVTATLWEDEGSLCFQVEAKGVCVARREDNHMINGTKLLNVAGMTRGRRDGILKSEKVRHVVKIGPMHLKGVWIPYQRALDFANKEKITELLYPLFVHNIGSLLYHPSNTNRTASVISAARREGNHPWPPSVAPGLPGPLQSQAGGPVGSAPQSAPSAPTPQRRSTDSLISPASATSATAPSLQTQNSSSLGAVSHSLPSHSIQTHHASSLARPNLERSMTFPTPPSSASSIMINSQDPQFWQPSSLANQQLAIDTTAMTTSRSMPATPMPVTPASTPPGGQLGQINSYSTSATAAYNDPYRLNSQANLTRYPNTVAQSQSQYMTNGRSANDMGPPQTARAQQAALSRPSSSQAQNDNRASNLGESSSLSHGGEVAEHGEEEADHEHEEEYTHDNNVQSYNASRTSSYYSSGLLPNDHSTHHSPEINGTAINGTGVPRTSYDGSSVAVPRTVETPSSAAARAPTDPSAHWTSSSSYTTSPHLTRYDSYSSVNSGDRSVTTDSHSNGSYPVQTGLVSLSHPYDQSSSGIAGPVAGTKRGRDDDDDHSRPSSRAGDGSDVDGMGIKRRKTGPISSPANSFNRDTNTLNRRQAIPAGVQQRRR